MNVFQRLGRIVRAKLSRDDWEPSANTISTDEPLPHNSPTLPAKHGSRRWAFEVLEVEEGTSQEEIRKAYLRLSRKYHPDNFVGNAEKLKTANTLMAQINNAYELLGH